MYQVLCILYYDDYTFQSDTQNDGWYQQANGYSSNYHSHNY